MAGIRLAEPVERYRVMPELVRAEDESRENVEDDRSAKENEGHTISSLAEFDTRNFTIFEPNKLGVERIVFTSTRLMKLHEQVREKILQRIEKRFHVRIDRKMFEQIAEQEKIKVISTKEAFDALHITKGTQPITYESVMQMKDVQRRNVFLRMLEGLMGMSIDEGLFNTPVSEQKTE